MHLKASVSCAAPGALPGPWATLVAVMECLAPPGPLGSDELTLHHPHIVVPWWALTGRDAENSLEAPLDPPCWPGSSCSTGRRRGGGAPMGGLWSPPSRAPHFGQRMEVVLPRFSHTSFAWLPSAWLFSLLTGSLVFKLVIQKYNLKLKAEHFVRAAWGVNVLMPCTHLLGCRYPAPSL